MLPRVLYSGWRIDYLFVRRMFCESRGKSVCILLIDNKIRCYLWHPLTDRPLNPTTVPSPHLIYRHSQANTIKDKAIYINRKNSTRLLIQTAELESTQHKNQYHRFIHNASPFSDINTQRKDKVNIRHITAYNKIVHKTTPTPTPYFGKTQEENPARP